MCRGLYLGLEDGENRWEELLILSFGQLTWLDHTSQGHTLVLSLPRPSKGCLELMGELLLDLSSFLCHMCHFKKVMFFFKLAF